MFASHEDAIGQFAAVLLATCGAMYIGFSLQKGARVQIAMEVTVATGFIAAALVGLWVTPWIVPVAWAAHGIWDYALVFIPLWYPPLCAFADWVAAASLAVMSLWV